MRISATRPILARPALASWPALATGTLAVAFVAFVAFRSTLLPGLGIWDTAEFQAVGPLLGVAHPTGYPGYVVLGWLASIVLQPLGSPAFIMNLLSAVLTAVAVGATVVTAAWLTSSTMLGVATGLGLAFTPIVWSISTRADPHALHVALVALLLVALLGWERRAGLPGRHADRWLVASAALFAVAVANHSLTLLLVPGIALFVLAREPDIAWRRPVLVLRCVLVIAVVAALLYAELPLRAGPFRASMVYGDPQTWDGFRYIVTAEQFRDALVDTWGSLDVKFAALVRLLDGQLGPLVPLLLPAFAVVVARRPRWALLTGPAFVLTCFFNASYLNADIDRYYLGPLLFAWSWLAIGAAALVDLARSVALEAGRPDHDSPGDAQPYRVGPLDAGRWQPERQDASAVVALATTLAVAALLLLPTATSFERTLRSVDASHDDLARAWTNAALRSFDPDAVVVSWWSFSTPLWYVQRIEGQRPDLTVVDDRTLLDEHLGDVTDVIDANLGRRTIYLVRIDQDELERLDARYRLTPVPMPPGQPVLRVEGRR